MQMKFEALEAKATSNSQKYKHLQANVAEEDKSIKEAEQELQKEEKELNQTRLAVTNAQKSEATPVIQAEVAATNPEDKSVFFQNYAQTNKTDVKTLAK